MSLRRSVTQVMIALLTAFLSVSLMLPDASATTPSKLGRIFGSEQECRNYIAFFWIFEYREGTSKPSLYCEANSGGTFILKMNGSSGQWTSPRGIHPGNGGSWSGW